MGAGSAYRCIRVADRSGIGGDTTQDSRFRRHVLPHLERVEKRSRTTAVVHHLDTWRSQRTQLRQPEPASLGHFERHRRAVRQPLLYRKAASAIQRRRFSFERSVFRTEFADHQMIRFGNRAALADVPIEKSCYRCQARRPGLSFARFR